MTRSANGEKAENKRLRGRTRQKAALASTEECLEERKDGISRFEQAFLPYFLSQRLGLQRRTSHIAAKSSAKKQHLVPQQAKAGKKDAVMRFMRAKNKDNATVEAE